jgi:hypothetical protein
MNAGQVTSLFRASVLLWVLSMLVSACGSNVNHKYSIEISGPCEKCPESRLDSVLKDIPGIYSRNYKDDFMILEVDSTVATRNILINRLNEAGYDFDMNLGKFIRDGAFLCCTELIGGEPDGDDDAGLLDEDDDLASLDESLEDSLFEDDGEIDNLDEDLDGDLIDEEDLFK